MYYHIYISVFSNKKTRNYLKVKNISQNIQIINQHLDHGVKSMSSALEEWN